MKVEVTVLVTPSLIVLKKKDLCGRKTTLNLNALRSGFRSCVKMEMGVLVSRSLIVLMVSVDVKSNTARELESSLFRVQELCESGGGRPGLPVLNDPLRSLWT